MEVEEAEEVGVGVEEGKRILEAYRRGRRSCRVVRPSLVARRDPYLSLALSLNRPQRRLSR